MTPYKPTAGDKAFVENIGDVSQNSFQVARLLRGVSDDYLSSLLNTNHDERSAGFRAQIQFELDRRSAVRVRSGLLMQGGAVAISLAALILSVIGLFL